MIINSNVVNKSKVDDLGEAAEMQINVGKGEHIFDMFINSFYSDRIGSIVREITSNSFDAHVEANVDSVKNPVVVRLTEEMNNTYISFIDRGIGMSPDRVKNIFNVFFNSTKRTTNELIGGFGVGGKTPLTYTNSFFIITRYNGIEYMYNIYVDNKLPSTSLMGQTPTDKPNGTEVKIPIKHSDIYNFNKSVLKQLYYFENIIFEGFNDDIVKNDYSIVKGEHFLYRGKSYSDYMHICYGKVAYPINWGVLDMPVIMIPVALKFDIGTLSNNPNERGVTGSREEIDYTDSVIENIKNKIELVLEELNQIIKKQHEGIDTLEKYFKEYQSKTSTITFPNNSELFIGSYKNQSKLPNFKYDEIFNLKHINSVFKYLYEIKAHNVSAYSYDKWDSDFTTLLKEKRKDVYKGKTGFRRDRKKQSYIKELHNGNKFYTLSLKEFVVPTYYDELSRILGVNKNLSEVEKKNYIDDFIKEFDEIVSDITQSYEELEIPEDFVIKRKKQNLEDDEIHIKGIYYGRNYPIALPIDKLLNISGRIYYGFRGDEDKLRDAEVLFRNITRGDYDNPFNVKIRGTVFVQISKASYKKLKDMGRKLIHVDYFNQTHITRKANLIKERLLGTSLYFKISSESSFIRDEDYILVDFSTDLWSDIQNVWADTNPQFNEVFKRLREYYTSYKYSRNLYVNDEIKKMVGFNPKTSVYDSEIYKDFLYYMEFVKKYKDRLQWISARMRRPSEEDMKSLTEVIKLLCN